MLAGGIYTHRQIDNWITERKKKKKQCGLAGLAGLGGDMSRRRLMRRHIEYSTFKDISLICDGYAAYSNYLIILIYEVGVKEKKRNAATEMSNRK